MPPPHLLSTRDVGGHEIAGGYHESPRSAVTRDYRKTCWRQYDGSIAATGESCRKGRRRYIRESKRHVQSSHSQGEEPGLNSGDSVDPSNHDGTAVCESNGFQLHTNVNYLNNEKRQGTYNKLHDSDDFARDKLTELRGSKVKDSRSRASDVDDRVEMSQRDPSAVRLNFSRTEGHTDGSFMNSKGNWLVIQRQLSQLERQQANLMNMLQDFMGGSHDSMVTLENRVRGLERVVEEMGRDLSLSSGVGDGRMPFAERFLSSERGRDPSRRRKKNQENMVHNRKRRSEPT